jgi:hypothetical protein
VKRNQYRYTRQVRCTDVEGGTPDPYNIDADPLAVDAPGGDCTLLPGSPCLNAGDPALTLDADGSIADLGACAYPGRIWAWASAARSACSGRSPT